MSPSRFTVGLYVFGAMAALMSVALSALASHGLAELAPTGDQAVTWFRIASEFQMDHALGLILAAAISDRVADGRAKNILCTAAVLLAAAQLFPIGLYSMSFHGPGITAPFGGVSAMAGWGLFAVGALLSLKSNARE